MGRGARGRGVIEQHVEVGKGIAMTRLSTGNGFPDVVVTGMAMTTALATDAENTWKKLLDGQSGIHKLEDPFVVSSIFPSESAAISSRTSINSPRGQSWADCRIWGRCPRFWADGWADAGSLEVDPRW